VKAAVKKICILRLSAIGDVCHALAMVQRVKQTWPAAEITWIIGKVEYQLLKGLEGIRFVVFDKSKGKLAYQQLKQALSGESFDYLLLMQLALRANLAASVINAKVKLGFDWQRSKELHWLFVNKRIQPQQHAHVLDGFMAFSDALGVPATQNPQWPSLYTQQDQQWAEEQKQQLGPFVVISPAASKAERNWLPERYAKIADYLSDKGYTVVLCGGPGKLDKTTGQAILQHTQSIKQNYIGHTSLKQFLALLQQAELVIAPDTGPAHMATMVATPVIGLYAHSNPRRTGPYNDLDKVVSVYEQCIERQKGKVWTQLKWGVRAKGKDLMSLITLPMVTEKIDLWLAGK